MSVDLLYILQLLFHILDLTFFINNLLVIFELHLSILKQSIIIPKHSHNDGLIMLIVRCTNNYRVTATVAPLLTQR